MLCRRSWFLGRQRFKHYRQEVAHQLGNRQTKCADTGENDSCSQWNPPAPENNVIQFGYAPSAPAGRQMQEAEAVNTDKGMNGAFASVPLPAYWLPFPLQVDVGEFLQVAACGLQGIAVALEAVLL
eukprot:gb/GECG01008316.1/.p1 GENE.gb/GECG01008316.1/~~gb/GECG01008316.1/.p1  ORF type:complete len:126 (+),score=14.70 gb/GECG01008316.1/:1-378(+)